MTIRGGGETLDSRNVAHCTIGAVCNPLKRAYGISSTVQDIEMSCSAASVNACRSVVPRELPRRPRRLRITRKPPGGHRGHRADFHQTHTSSEFAVRGDSRCSSHPRSSQLTF
jgi:hypothetical protein